MATQSTAASDAFYKQLGRMYGTYTGGFIALHYFAGRSLNRSAYRTRFSATCSCFSRSLFTLSLAWRRAPRRFPSITSPAGACRPSITAWRPAPTGCRRHRSSAWPARCSCSAMTASPGCSAGPAASCWFRSWSGHICASSAPIRCPTLWPSASAATSRASSR